jgi:plastocyanin
VSTPRRAAAALLVCALAAVCALAGPALVAGAAGGHARAQRSAARRAPACRPHRNPRQRRCPVSSTRAKRRASPPAGGPPTSSGSGHSGPTGGSGGAAPSGSTAPPRAGSAAGEAPASGSRGQATTPSETPPIEAPAGGPARVQVIAKEYSFTLSRAEVPAGKVIVEFVNGGEDPHNLHLAEPAEGAEAGAFPTSSPGFHGDLTLNLHPGAYTLFCSLPGHEAKGMKATLIVR